MWKNNVTGEIVDRLPKSTPDGTNIYSLKVWECTFEDQLNEEGETVRVETSREDTGWDFAALAALGWEEFTIPSFDAETQCLDETYTVIPLPDEVIALRLSNAKDNMKNIIEQRRASVLLAGVAYLGKNFACSPEAKTNMMIQYLGYQIDGSFPVDFGWKALTEDTLTPMTEDQFKGLIKLAGAYCNQVYVTSFSLKQQVDKLTSISEVNNFSISFE